jgi:hypothetical protein
MGGTIATITGWTLGVIVVYLLLTHGSASQGIIGSSTGGGVALIKGLQGR